MMPVEFLFFALFFVLLDVTARKRSTDGGFLRPLRVWTAVQGVLFVVFTALVYTMEKGFMTPYGALYLLSLGLVFGVTIRMRETVEAVAR
jgi:DMSO reductase anchor subunit